MNKVTTQNRGDATRDALLLAGVEIFARDGFEAASSRALATHAGVNQALISYHFGSKRGLYVAVFEYVAEQFGEMLSPLAEKMLAEITQIENASSRRAERCVACMETLMFTMLEILSQSRTVSWAKLIVREQQEPTEAFDVLYNGVMGRMLAVLTRLVVLASGDSVESPAHRLCAVTLVGQVLVFRVAHATVLRHMGWQKGIRERELEAVREQIRLNLHCRFIGRSAS